MKDTKTSVSKKKEPVRVPGVPAVDPGRKQALESYTAALKLMQDGKFEKAQAAFEKLLEHCPADIAERARLYLAACIRQMQEHGTRFTTIEEHFDYAVSLLNQGLYEDAREQLEEILKKNRTCDFALYGLAVLNSMTGQTEKSLENLSEAIRLNPQNRIQARGDADFQDIMDDPRFTELLYPEFS
jgi:tetratricopeptide (TPR) repeat protein